MALLMLLFAMVLSALAKTSAAPQQGEADFAILPSAVAEDDECAATDGCALNALQVRTQGGANVQDEASAMPAVESTRGGTKVICPGYGYNSAACYGTFSQYSPSEIIAWSGGTSTAALGYAINPNSVSAFAAWVVTHPDFTYSGTPFEFYKAALTPQVFSWLNSRLYLGMACGLMQYYYLLHDFDSAEDMAKALCASGNEAFTGTSTVNGVDLSSCTDSFGGWEAVSGGIPAQARGALGYSTGRWVDVYKYMTLLGPTSAAEVETLVNNAWDASTSISTAQTFTSSNCLCSRNGCNIGC